MALKISTDEHFDVEVDGKNFSVKVPSLKGLGQLDKETKEKKTEDLPEFYQDYFASLGLPKTATENFSLKNWHELIKEISGVKNV